MNIIVTDERLVFLRKSVSNDIVHLVPSMGGEIEQLLKNTEDMIIPCGNCYGYHSTNIWFASPHPGKSDGILTDKEGNTWWPYILCSESNYQHAYRHIKKLFVKFSSLEELRVKITSGR